MTSTTEHTRHHHLRVVGDGHPGSHPDGQPDDEAVEPAAVATDGVDDQAAADATPAPPASPAEQPEGDEPSPDARNARARAREEMTSDRSGVDHLLRRLFRSRGVRKAREVVVLPDLWRLPQPSLRDVWRHVIWGQHVGGDGGVRFVYALAWIVVCAPMVTICSVGRWWHDRLDRALVGWLLLWALLQLPYVQDAVDIVVAVLTFRWHLIGIGG